MGSMNGDPHIGTDYLGEDDQGIGCVVASALGVVFWIVLAVLLVLRIF